MDNIVSLEKLNIDKSEWVLTTLGELATEISKRVDNPAESEFDRFVGLEHFVSGHLKIKKWGVTENLTSSTKAFKQGDILFARRNAYLRRASLVDFEGCCSGDAFVLRENSDKLVPGFLAFIVNSNSLWEYANANAAGTMSKRVKWRDLAEFELKIPSKVEQEKLSDLLWSANKIFLDAIKVRESLHSFYSASREFYNFILDEGSKCKNHRVLKANVNSSIKFDRLGQHLKSIKYGTSKKSNSDGKGVGVLGIPNVVNEELTTERLSFVELTDKEYEAASLKAGDILIVRSNGNPSYTGRSALYNLEGGHVYASYLIKLSVDKEVFDPEFLVRYLQSRAPRRYFKRNATSSAGNYNINTDTIKSIPVPIFSLQYQREVVAKLKEVESILKRNDEHIDSSRFLLENLINQVI
ncbi:TPA: hypothetical protein I7241_10770 [Vibrio vulnificus]|nr:hypothetical protein [Vibrio vulnificus]